MANNEVKLTYPFMTKNDLRCVIDSVSSVKLYDAHFIYIHYGYPYDESGLKGRKSEEEYLLKIYDKAIGGDTQCAIILGEFLVKNSSKLVYSLPFLETAYLDYEKDALYLMGKAYSVGNRFDKALEFYKKSYSKGGTIAVVNIGDTYCKLNRHLEAVDYYLEFIDACEEDFNNPHKFDA